MSELEKKESSEILNSNQLLEETIFSENPFIYEITDSIKEDTTHIKMGSALAENLLACSRYLELRGIQTNDPSKALDVSTLRVLKLLPGILALLTKDEDEDNYLKSLFENLVNEYILAPDKEYLRTTIFNPDIPFDQIMREEGAAVNIRRHITEDEMRQVFGYVRDIFSDYSSKLRK